MKTVGIVAHSFEGAALCFITACREGVAHLGPHMHPKIVMSAVPLGLSMPGWEAHDHSSVAKFLTEGVQMVADAGADFYVCPDNTAHIVLEQIADGAPKTKGATPRRSWAKGDTRGIAPVLNLALFFLQA